MRPVNFDISINFEVFRTRLKELMEKKGENAAQLAIECDMTAATLSRYLTGRRDPEINYAVRLAQHFAVSLDWLLGLSEDSGARYSPEIISLANKYIHATKDDKQVIDLILSKYAE